MKTLIVVAFVGILGALAWPACSCCATAATASPRRGNMMRALAVRVGAVGGCCSLFILLSYWLGWIQPTGIPLGSERSAEQRTPLAAALVAWRAGRGVTSQ